MEEMRELKTMTENVNFKKLILCVCLDRKEKIKGK